MADEHPANVVTFANTPGMITLTWDRSGDDVYWFVVEQESPYTFWPADTFRPSSIPARHRRPPPRTTVARSCRAMSRQSSRSTFPAA
jgi:hypothetical protein